MENRLIGLSALTVIILALSLTSAQNSSQPEIPLVVMGEVFIDEMPASNGTVVTAVMEGEELEPVILKGDNMYALVIGGTTENDAGKVISLYVNGIDTDQTVSWKSGEIKELDLYVTTPSEETEDNVGSNEDTNEVQEEWVPSPNEGSPDEKGADIRNEMESSEESDALPLQAGSQGTVPPISDREPVNHSSNDSSGDYPFYLILLGIVFIAGILIFKFRNSREELRGAGGK